MRVTESSLIKIANRAIAQETSRMAKAANVLSSGVAVDRPSENHADWASGVRSRVALEISSAHGNAIARGKERLNESELALDDVGLNVSRAYELAVQAANGTLSASDRESIASELTQIRASVLGQMNARSRQDGTYLFAGTEVGEEPFDDAGNYTGADDFVTVEGEAGRPSRTTLSGTIFTDGVNILGALDGFIEAVRNNDVVSIGAAVNSTKTAVEEIALARSEIGSHVNALEQADETRKSFEVGLQNRYARTIAADPIEAATELAESKLALESARAVAEQLISIALRR